MNNKLKLLSIGEMAKLTGVSTKSLRYYERINILKPVYTNPDTGYRFYSYDQQNLVGMLMTCVDLGIPLKEIARFTDEYDTVDFRKFVDEGRAIAEKKLKAMKNSVAFIKDVQQKIELADSYPFEQVYSRDTERMVLYVKYCGQSLKDIDELELRERFSDLPFPDETPNGLTEFGYLCECTGSASEYFAYLELPKRMAKSGNKIIPAAKNYCYKSNKSQIEIAAEIFKEQLGGADSYLAFETEIFAGSFSLSKPLYELRIIW